VFLSPLAQNTAEPFFTVIFGGSNPALVITTMFDDEAPMGLGFSAACFLLLLVTDAACLTGWLVWCATNAIMPAHTA
jgi:hypothetical protein